MSPSGSSGASLRGLLEISLVPAALRTHNGADPSPGPKQRMPSKILQMKSGPAAYRADETPNGVPRRAGSRDSSWLTVTSLLEHAPLAGAERPRLVARATDIACESLGEDVVRSRGDREWRDHRTPTDAILLLADDAYEADAFHTAITMLTALDRADPELTNVQRGRLLGRRGRALARLGRLDDASDHFHSVERLGKHAMSAELRARAWLGLASLAQMRGDYAAVESLSRRALRLAKREGLSFIERYSRLGLTVAAGARHDFDAALFHGWAVYLASAGQPMEEGEILQTFGQIMVEARCFAEARAAFAAVVSRALPARILVPALGGLATAAAHTGRTATVRWAANQLNMLASAGAPRYVLALAFEECGAALARLGLLAASAELNDKATAIAVEHGFHEVTTRAAQLTRRSAENGVVPVALRHRAVRIAGRIASMEPGQLPHQVSVIAVPA